MREKLLLVAIIFGVVFLWNQNQNQNICANSISCIKDLSGIKEEAREALWHGAKVDIPSIAAPLAKVILPKEPVLGETTGGKRIEVDLTHQRVYAFEGENKVFDFPTSTGKWYPTPTGEFRIWVKLRYTKMEGGNPADNTYYYLPNVPYVMFFANNKIAKSRGFGLHGTYWHNNFGHPMSHGCVNMRTEDVAQLYTWAEPTTGGNTTYATADNPGTRLVIYGQAPRE